eukprot:1192216-Prorocentrum_minimum.AAC.2
MESVCEGDVKGVRKELGHPHKHALTGDSLHRGERSTRGDSDGPDLADQGWPVSTAKAARESLVMFGTRFHDVCQASSQFGAFPHLGCHQELGLEVMESDLCGADNHRYAREVRMVFCDHHIVCKCPICCHKVKRQVVITSRRYQAQTRWTRHQTHIEEAASVYPRNER